MGLIVVFGFFIGFFVFVSYFFWWVIDLIYYLVLNLFFGDKMHEQPQISLFVL